MPQRFLMKPIWWWHSCTGRMISSGVERRPDRGFYSLIGIKHSWLAGFLALVIEQLHSICSKVSQYLINITSKTDTSVIGVHVKCTTFDVQTMVRYCDHCVVDCKSFYAANNIQMLGPADTAVVWNAKVIFNSYILELGAYLSECRANCFSKTWEIFMAKDSVSKIVGIKYNYKKFFLDQPSVNKALYRR